MARPRAADDFAAIRGRMEELQRERKKAVSDAVYQTHERDRRSETSVGQVLRQLLYKHRGQLRQS